MNIKIIYFPGTNREKDMADAFETVTGKRPDIVWHKETDLGNPDLIVLPGGFSHGDYLRCGAMAAHSPIMREVIKQAKDGTPLFAVCNGFQMLMETELLPGALLHNNHLKFNCKKVGLNVQSNDNRFMKGLEAGETLRDIPIAHGDGNYFIDHEGLKAIQDNNQIAFTYAENPNGSTADIAGITNKRGTILGMMPHPENATRGHQDTKLDGLKLFESIIR